MIDRTLTAVPLTALTRGAAAIDRLDDDIDRVLSTRMRTSALRRTAGRARRRMQVADHRLRRESETLWRHAFNAAPSREHRRHPPFLTAEAGRVLDTLNSDGVATSTLEDLTGSSTLLSELRVRAAELEKLTRHRQAEQRLRLTTVGKARASTGVGEKAWTVTLLDLHRPEIHPRDVLARVAVEPTIKGIADEYYGMRTRVADLNVWRTLTSPDPALATQMWHRDLPEDHYILKMFIYLEDVTIGAGPFSYVRGSHRKGTRPLDLVGRHDGICARYTDDQMDRAVGREAQEMFPGPAGTVVFADTTGCHKGGLALDRSRLVMQTLWASHAATRARQLAAPPGVRPADWPDFAYTRGVDRLRTRLLPG